MGDQLMTHGCATYTYSTDYPWVAYMGDPWATHEPTIHANGRPIMDQLCTPTGGRPIGNSYHAWVIHAWVSTANAWEAHGQPISDPQGQHGIPMGEPCVAHG